MKYFVFICLLTLAISGCKKSLNNESLPNDLSVSTATTNLIPAPPYQWRNLGVPTLTQDPGNEAEMQNYVYTLNGDNYLATGFHFRKVFKFNTTNKSWTAMPSMTFEPIVTYGLHLAQGCIMELRLKTQILLRLMTLSLVLLHNWPVSPARLLTILFGLYWEAKVTCWGGLGWAETWT